MFCSIDGLFVSCLVWCETVLFLCKSVRAPTPISPRWDGGNFVVSGEGLLSELWQMLRVGLVKNCCFSLCFF